MDPKSSRTWFITSTNKWIASDIPRGFATEVASEYNKYLPCIEIPCGLAEGSLQYTKLSIGCHSGFSGIILNSSEGFPNTEGFRDCGNDTLFFNAGVMNK